MENTNEDFVVRSGEYIASLTGVGKLIYLFILSLFVVFVIKIVMMIITKMLRNAQKNHKGFTPILCNLICKITQVLGWIFAILCVLGIWGINLAPVIAGLGITGVVLGFALQESISSLFSGFMLAVNNPFQLGDFVEIGGVSGTVKDMDMMSVTLLTIDNRKVTMSNRIVWGSTIINYSAEDLRRVDLVASIPYGSDVKKAKEVIMNLLKSYPITLTDPVPTVEVVKLGESTIDLTVRPWVKNANYWDMFFAFQQDVGPALKKAGFEIAYKKVDVTVTNKA